MAIKQKLQDLSRMAVSKIKTAHSEFKEARERAKIRAANARAAQQRETNLRDFDIIIAKLTENSKFINPKSWAHILQFSKNANPDPDILGQFARHAFVTNLSEYANNRAEFYLADLERSRKNFTFGVSVDEFFDSIGNQTAEQLMSLVAKRYMLSNSGNAIAAGVLGSRKNYGGMALAVADSVKIGAHNAKVKTAFTNHMRHLSYTLSSANINEQHRLFIRFAHRALFYNVGNRKEVMKALFCLIYNNGRATPTPPNPLNEFSGALHTEFNNSFIPHLWTIAQAANYLEGLCKGNEYVTRMYSSEDMVPFLQGWKDEVPDFAMIAS